MAEVRLSEVSKIYPDGTKAVDAISLEIKSGEFLSVLGPSGCGKTTLMRIISGLYTANRGMISLDGQDVAALSASPSMSLDERSICRVALPATSDRHT
ncbi:MAG: ATP-binding cassette domain-containing protein [Geminicoccaceae bacterium]